MSAFAKKYEPKNTQGSKTVEAGLFTFFILFCLLLSCDAIFSPNTMYNLELKKYLMRTEVCGVGLAILLIIINSAYFVYFRAKIFKYMNYL